MKPLIFLCLIVTGGVASGQTNPLSVLAKPVTAPVAATTSVAADSTGMPWQPPLPGVTNFWNAQLRSSKRVVSGLTIDIAPLVRWHTNPSNLPRPLTAWKYVTGKLAGQTTYGWKVTGYLDGEPQPRPFIIKNPPTAFLAEFNQLKQAYEGMLQRQSRLDADLEHAQLLYDQTEAEFKRLNYFRFAGDLLDQRLDAVNAIRGDLAALNNDLQSFDGRGHDPKGEFTVRCFGVKTAQVFNGMLIYDHGFVIP